jgi:hypothetical protein
LAATFVPATPFLHSAGSITAPPSLHLFGRRIDRRATIISVIAVPHSFQRSGESHRRTNINNNNNNNSTQRHHLFGTFLHSAGASIAAPQSFQWAGESHRRAAIISAGRKIPSPRLILFCVPANPIAAPQSFHRAGASIAVPQSFPRAGGSHRRAGIFLSGRRISSPRRNLFHGPANPIAAPQSFHRAGESHHRVTIFSTGR